jgi:uncharacterized protein YggE
MRIRTFSLALLAIGLSIAPAAAQMGDLPPSSITITGEATLSVAPDRAIVRSGVVSQAKTAREAIAANSKAMAAVLAALKEAGVADADVQTAQFSLDTLRGNRENPQQVTGFQASNRVSVQLRDIGKVGEILDRLVGAGANSIQGIEFVVSDASKLLDKVRAEAIADARRKAEIYAQAAGVGLGRPLMIAEQGAPPRPMMRMAAPASGAALPIAAGEEQIGITVTVAYELMR